MKKIHGSMWAIIIAVMAVVLLFNRSSALPIGIILLACPLMMLFMMHGMNNKSMNAKIHNPKNLKDLKNVDKSATHDHDITN